MRFAYLGSGSRGNAAVIESNQTRLMLDCGFSIKETERRLARLELGPSDLSGILVTHEHSDHISGVGAFARRHKVPVWITPGTFASNKTGEIPHMSLVNSHQAFSIGDINVQPVPVPHDAKEPCQYIFNSEGLRLGILTDVGHITPHIQRHYARCDCLVIECNHDVEMLRVGPYPYTLKQRVGGNYGHLNNQQAASMLRHADHKRLQMVMAVHVSEKNNSKNLVSRALKDELGSTNIDVQIADQSEGSPWQCLKSLVGA